MKRRENEIKLPVTVVQILGIVLLLTGLGMLFGFGLTAYREVNTDPQDSLPEYQTEIDAGISEDVIESRIVLNNRKQAAGHTPFIILGGIFVIASVPLFYAPYAGGLTLRLRKKEEPWEKPQMSEQFVDEDYSPADDSYSYILDENIRNQLIRKSRKHP